jgi:hypothetical protein
LRLSSEKTVSSLCFQFQLVYRYIKEYLLTGIPEAAEPPAPAAAPAPGAAAAAAGGFAAALGGAAPGGPNTQPLNLFPEVGLCTS